METNHFTQANPAANFPPPQNFTPPFAPPPQPPVWPKPPKPVFPLNVIDLVFAGVLLIISIIFVSLTFWGQFHSGFTASYFLFFIVLSAYFIQNGGRIKIIPAVLGLLSLGVALNFSISNNPTVNFWSLFCIFCLSAVWFASLTGKDTKTGDLGLFHTVFGTVFGNAFRCGTTLRSVGKACNSKNRTFSKIMVGVCCAIPLLFIVLPLLIRSDAAFEGLIHRVFGNSGTVFCKILLGTFVAVFALSYAFGLKKLPAAPQKEHKFKGLEPTGIAAFLSVLSLCYLTYLFAQLSYLFKAFFGFLPENFTAAQYARRGFFEMCAVAAINLAVLFTTMLLARKKNEKPPVVLRIISTFIGLFTLTIISTAIAKMVLYIHSFGMTVLRLTTSAFMVFLALVTVATMLRCFLPRIPVLKIALAFAAVILMVLGIGNVNRMVASYNYKAYVSHTLSEIDVNTLAEMGDAGVPYLILLTEDKNPNVARQAHNAMADFIRQEYQWKGKKTPKEKKQALGSSYSTRQQALEKTNEYIAKTKNSTKHLSLENIE